MSKNIRTVGERIWRWYRRRSRFSRVAIAFMLAIVMMWFAAGAVDSYSQYRMDWLADTACRGITPGMSVTEARATLQELGLSLVSPILEPDPLHVRFPQQPYFLAMIHGGFQFNIVTRDVQVIITLDPAAQHVQSITRRDVLTGP